MTPGRRVQAARANRRTLWRAGLAGVCAASLTAAVAWGCSIDARDVIVVPGGNDSEGVWDRTKWDQSVWK